MQPERARCYACLTLGRTPVSLQTRICLHELASIPQDHLSPPWYATLIFSPWFIFFWFFCLLFFSFLGSTTDYLVTYLG